MLLSKNPTSSERRDGVREVRDWELLYIHKNPLPLSLSLAFPFTSVQGNRQADRQSPQRPKGRSIMQGAGKLTSFILRFLFFSVANSKEKKGTPIGPMM
jgi:hypothetical protein